MARIDVIGCLRGYDRSVRVTVFEYDDMLVFDKARELYWFRNGNLSDRKMQYPVALDYINKINSSSYGGYNNWRMPDIYELNHMAMYALDSGWGDVAGHRVSDYFNSLIFDGLMCDLYWSSTVNLENDWAYGISMSIGKNCYVRKEHDGYVWPVRS